MLTIAEELEAIKKHIGLADGTPVKEQFDSIVSRVGELEEESTKIVSDNEENEETIKNLVADIKTIKLIFEDLISVLEDQVGVKVPILTKSRMDKLKWEDE